MATVTTTIKPTQALFSFAGIVDPYAVATNFPRGQIQCSAQNSAIALSGAGDNQRLLIRIDLPMSYGYVMTDFCVAIQSETGGTNNFGSQALLDMYNALGTADRTKDVPIGATSQGNANGGPSNNEVKYYRPFCPYKGIIIGAEPQEQIRVEFDIFNETANDAAYTCDFEGNFLQFDIEQLNDVVVNTPQLVR